MGRDQRKHKAYLLNDEMRYEVAEILRQENLEEANRKGEPVQFKETFYTRFGKRALDITFSGVALLVTLPINLVLLVGTALDVGRPIFFSQKRVGKNGKLFNLVKFRNMTNDVDKNGDLLPAKDRVTKFGSFVRKTSLDELLNFWSVFKGDMSLIGPRPLTTKAARKFTKRHASRNLVRPGLECPIRGVDNAQEWETRFEHDVWYVENVSFRTDLKLMLDLLLVVVDKRQTEVRASTDGHGGPFMGYGKDGRALALEDVPEKILDEVLKEHGVYPDGEEYA